MASSFYDPCLESWVAGGAGHSGAIVDLEEVVGGSAIRGAFVDTATYTFSAAHDYYDDVAAGVLQDDGGSADVTFALAGNAVSQLVPGIKFDATDLTGGSQITGVGDGTLDLDALILYDAQGGSDATNPLICFIDTGTGFEIQAPNNSTIEITWNASGIFTIGA